MANNVRMFFLRIFISSFLFLSSACYLNPVFKDLVSSDEKKEESLVPLLLILSSTAASPPVIQGETIFFPSTGLTWMRCSRGQTYNAASDSCTGF